MPRFSQIEVEEILARSKTLAGMFLTDSVPPPAPSISVTAEFSSVIVAISMASAPEDLAGYSVYRNTSNVSGTAVKVGAVLSASDGQAQFIDTTADIGTNYYYWAKAIDFAGNVGPFSSVAGPVMPAKIESGQIAAGAINVAAIFGPGVVDAAALANNAVTPIKTCLAAIDATSGNLTANSVTSCTIVAGAICTCHILAGAVTACTIASGAVTTSKLAVAAAGAALNDDPGFLDSTAWTGFSYFCTVSDGKVGNQTARSLTGSCQSVYAQKYIPFDATKSYRVRVWARKSSSNGTFYAGVQFLDANGCNVASGGGSYWYIAASGVVPGDVWTEYYGIFGATGCAICSCARTMRPIAILNYSGSAGYMEIQDLRIEEATPSTLIQDGAITSAKILAGSICAGHINAAGISADCLTAGTICADRITALNGTTGYGGVSLTCAIQNQGKNLLPDPDFRGVSYNADYITLTSGASYGDWTVVNTGSGASYSAHKQTTNRSNYLYPGSNSIWQYGTSTANWARVCSRDLIPAKAGASYYVSAYAASHSGYNCPRVYVGLYFYNSDGTCIGGSNSNIVSGCTAIPSTPIRLSGTVAAPANTAYMKVSLDNYPTAASYVYWSAVSVEERDSSSASLTPWSAGESGTITANRVIAGALRSLNWDADSGSYFDLNAGTFCLGGSSAPKLKWDGSTLTVNGVVCATSGCFSGTLTSTAGTIGGWTICNGYMVTCSAAGGGCRELGLYACCSVIWLTLNDGTNAHYTTIGRTYWDNAYKNLFGFAVARASCPASFAAGTVCAETLTLPDSSTAALGCPVFWVGTSTSYMKWYNGLLTLNGAFRITRCASDITGPWISLQQTCSCATCECVLYIQSCAYRSVYIENLGSARGGPAVRVVGGSVFADTCCGIATPIHGEAWYGSCPAVCGYRYGGDRGVVGVAVCVSGCGGGCYGVYGYAGVAYPVAGNGAYYNASTRFLKTAFEDVEVLPGLRCLCIQKWTWNDQNMKGFDEFIGPVAEDVQAAFRLTFANEGVYQLDGIALKAAQELDACITAQNLCIESLAARLANIESRLSQCA